MGDLLPPIGLRLPKELTTTLKKIAKKSGCSLAAIIRATLLEAYPERETE